MARCLVIATTTSLRLLVAAQLEEAGHDVWIAAGAPQGAARLDEVDAELVVLELRTAFGDGLEAIHRIIAREPHVPVLTMSAEPVSSSVRVAFDADEHMSNVFDRVECLAKVDELLRLRAKQVVRPFGRQRR